MVAIQAGIPEWTAIALAFAAGLLACALVLAWRRHAPGARGRMAGGSDFAFRTLVDGMQDTAIWMLDASGRVVTWNAAAEKMQLRDASNAAAMRAARVPAPAAHAAETPKTVLDQARMHGSYRSREWRSHADGSSFYADVAIEPVLDSDGRLRGYAKIVRDITREKEAEDKLAALSHNLDVALDNMQQGLCLYDAEERLLLANDRVSEIYGFAQDALRPGMHYRDVLELARTHRGSGAREAAVAAKSAYRLHADFMHEAEGGTMVTEYPDGMVLSVSERPLAHGGWVSTFEDISDRYRSEQRIRHMALHDTLTGLPNREQFREHAAGQISSAQAGAMRLALASVDIHRLKDINDRHGHGAADELLRQVASRIESALEGTGFAARLGGDEFAVLRPVSSEAEAEELGRRLSAQLTDTIVAGGQAIPNAVSIGVAVYPEDGATYEELAANAVLAMNRAKRTPGSRICRYRLEMDEDARRQRALEADLRDALETGQFHLAYQVQCEVSTGEPLGYEALLRWNHPTLGAVPPDRFIPIAEDSGLILPIGDWVLRQACRDAACWARPLKVAVNISPVQLVHRELPARITQALLDAGLPPSRLEIEITETAIVSDKLRALHNLRQIKALGVSVAIDDFGTGYASLDTLHSFEFDKIKIDRSFLMDCTRKPRARAIIRAVLALGKSLGMPVLAEGVETDVHLQLLRDEDCAEAQGFFFGRPGEVAKQEELARSAVAN